MDIIKALLVFILLVTTVITVYNFIKLRNWYREYFNEQEEYKENIHDLYNIKEFNKRIEDIKKEEFSIYDGIPLYDVNAKNTKDELSAGVEIITNSYEMEVEKRIRR